jgi:hypothetical protein
MLGLKKHEKIKKDGNTSISEGWTGVAMCVANVDTIKLFINIQSASVPQINLNKKLK